MRTWLQSGVALGLVVVALGSTSTKAAIVGRPPIQTKPLYLEGFIPVVSISGLKLEGPAAIVPPSGLKLEGLIPTITTQPALKLEGAAPTRGQ